MTKLTRTTAAALLTASLLATAGAASAQPAYGYAYGPGGYERERYGSDWRRETAWRAGEIRDQLDDLARRIDRNDRRDRISEREAWGLRREVRAAREQFRWMNRDGLDHRELRHLQARVDHIRWQLRGERADWNDRRG
ncbi:hypothetical protein [Novosphingobium sp.]|uniref:hypothetical protein n=1 Tax=Novosphingobium sp. TaxID=1874826 RepID=UPI002602110B|nr:hypothetical protein [Novosphingobium sp.]